MQVLARVQQHKLLVPVLTNRHTTAQTAYYNAQVLARYDSTKLHALLLLVLTDKHTTAQTAHNTLMRKCWQEFNSNKTAPIAGASADT